LCLAVPLGQRGATTQGIRGRIIMQPSQAVSNGQIKTTAPSAWHALPAADAVELLSTDASHGLNTEEAARRLARDGPNAFEAARKTPWQEILARQFLSVLILILVVAAVISFVVGETVDAVAILAIVVLNGILGFVQEWRAEEALEALRRMLAPQSRVVRDGQEREIESRSLVRGDVVLLDTGDRIPADIRLIEAIALRADESLLSGESSSVSKTAAPVAIDAPVAERGSMAWMGTNVTSGSGRGVVVATGESTEFGRIAHLTETLGEEKTPLQKRLASLGRQVGIFAICVSAVVAVMGWLAGKPLFEMFLTGISLAVAVVPEGLPAVVTIALALGVRTMARRRALLRRLQAAETLGAASVICTDKTGTLTQNEMTVSNLWLPRLGHVEVTGTGYAPIGDFRREALPIHIANEPDLTAMLESALRCNHARVYPEADGWHRLGEPTEAALVVAAMKAGLEPESDVETATEVPFDSTRKRMTVVERWNGGLLAHVKGAPEVLLERSTRFLDGDTERELTPYERARILAATESMAADGLRVLAVARRRLPAGAPLDPDEIERELTFVGLAGMIDPPRTEVPASVRMARAAKIKVIVVTGDAAATASAIARRIGLPVDRVVTGRELGDFSDDELRDALDENVLFARISPEDKIRIVAGLQALGHVVCMTGDGVNDAPALKKADVGVSMGLRGTDVAKGASDLVLTDDNFASIVNAIEEGRRQWDNIQKFVRYLLSSNMGEVTAIFFNTLLGGPLILLPVQILWINLVTDGVTAVALGVEPASKGILQRPPRPVKQPILGRTGMWIVLALGGYLGFGTIWLFHHYLAIGGGHERLPMTMAFCGLVILEKMNVFNFRSLQEPLSAIGYASNRPLVFAWISMVVLQVAAVYVPFLQRVLHTVPLSLEDWAVIVAFALPVVLVPEAIKWVRGRASAADRAA
jgi:Ca2+-transporting ATPase